MKPFGHGVLYDDGAYLVRNTLGVLITLGYLDVLSGSMVLEGTDVWSLI